MRKKFKLIYRLPRVLMIPLNLPNLTSPPLPACQHARSIWWLTHPTQLCSYLLVLCIPCSHCLQCPSLCSLPTGRSKLMGDAFPGKPRQGVRLPLCCHSQRGWSTPTSVVVLDHVALGALAQSVLFPKSLIFKAPSWSSVQFWTIHSSFPSLKAHKITRQ